MNLYAEIANLWKRIVWKPFNFTLIEIILIAAVYPAMLYANPQWFIEDDIVENLQLIILAAAFIIALKSPKDKELFIFAAFIIVFLFMREINMGRGLFCKEYFPQKATCRWHDFKYGYLAEAIRMLFALCVFIFFIYKKVYKTIWKYVKAAPIFIWDSLILVLAAVGAEVSEFPCIDNEIMEESCETIMYIALTGLVWQYSRNKVFSIKE